MNTGKRHNIAKGLSVIPLIVLAVAMHLFVLATVLEGPTNRGIIYSICALISILCIFLAPLPCLAISVSSIIYAVKSIREGNRATRKYLILGIVEAVVAALFMAFAFVLFIDGQSI